MPGRQVRSGLGRVGARNSATPPDLQIFVDGSAESVTSDDLVIGCFGLGECSYWGGLVERLGEGRAVLKWCRYVARNPA
jgi:hypothetical protein